MSNVLTYVKNSLGITGEYQDEMLKNYIADITAFMIDAGVDKKIVKSEDAYGAISRGVADLWNYGAGDGQLSAWFYQRVTQLRYKHVGKKVYHDDPELVKDYLYTMNFNKLDYAKAKDFFAKYKPTSAGSCSCWRDGLLYYRLYDWKFDNCAEFVVKTENDGTRYATMGIAGGISQLTNDFVADNDECELYDVVPFFVVDGINEHGVVANVNVAPIDHGKTTGSIATKGTAMELCGLQVVRFILDHFNNAKEACEYIRDYVSVYNPSTLNYTLHYMVADAEDTYIIEFYGNECVIKNVNDAPYMTNFYLSDVIFNADGTVNTPTSDERPSVNNITDHGAGLERYNLIVTNEGNNWQLLNNLKYTNAYINREWLTEFVGDELTVNGMVEDFEPILDKAHNAFVKRIRNGQTWQSVHACEYNMNTKALTVMCQEDGEKIKFIL